MHWKGHVDRVLKSSPPWKVMFLGTDHFALHILKALHADFIKKYLPFRTDAVVGRLDVVTKKSKGDVKNFVSMNSNDIKLHVWPDVDIRPGEFDVGVVASFGQLIPKKFIELFPYGILNVHPSLLPRWRGCTPIAYSILAGDKVTGVTIQEIQPHRFDIGPIVNQTEVPIPPDITSLQLSDILAKVGADLIIDTLRDLAHLEDIDQDDRLACYAPKITADDPRLWIDWNEESCRQIDRKFRAFRELHDFKSYFGEHRVKLRNPVPMRDVWWYTLRDSYLASRPGSAVYIKPKQCMVIQCKDGLVGLRDVVVKKPLTAASFYNGYLSKPHLKYTRFSNKMIAEPTTSQPKVMTRKKLNKLQKHWHLQLLRIGSTPSD